MFGLRNQKGSCWVNAGLQGVLRIPDLQQRFSQNKEDDNNPVEVCLSEIWNSRGEEGLRDLYSCVKTSTMPAGEGIGDSHEFIEFLCDKVPLLDKLMRFKVAQTIECVHCGHKEVRKDSMLEFSVSPAARNQRIIDTITEAVQPHIVPDWRCDECKQRKGCKKQLLLSEFPRVLMIHKLAVNATVSYTPIMVLNNIHYALFAVVCFTGGHWMTWGRNLPPGQPWYKLDDSHIQKYDSTRMPQVDSSLRLLMYYRLTE